MTGVWFVICIPAEEGEDRDITKMGSVEDVLKLSPKSCRLKEKATKQNSIDSKVSSSGTFSTAPSVADGDGIPAASRSKFADVEESGEKFVFGGSQELNCPSQKIENDKKSEEDYLIDFVERGMSMEKLLDDALERLAITEAVWVLSQDRRIYQVSFPCDSGSRCDKVLRYLTARGIGLHRGSTIGIMPCAIFYRERKAEEEEEVFSSMNLDSQSECADSKPELKKELTGLRALQRDFLKSITSRLTVAQVVEGVRCNASLTFDFTALIIFASVIAAIGLMENNSIILVASMLISPLMGPILAGTFGAVVQDHSLWRTGCRTELLGLTLCVVLGFLIGLIHACVGWNQIAWPTLEMSSRGQLWNLLTGAFIALPSGGGVALSVLGGNIGSLVGVAISASLLPPAVNAGLLWGMAVIFSGYSKSTTFSEMGQQLNGTSSKLVLQAYQITYSDVIAKECAILGTVSLLLTVVNIVCIFVAAVFVLKIKEVAPNTNVPKTRRFWKKDIKIARDYNKTVRRCEADTMGKQVLEEWSKLNELDPKEALSSCQAKLMQLHTLRSIVEDVEADGVYQTVLRNLSGGSAVEPLSQNLMTWPPPDLASPNSYPSLWDLAPLTNDPEENHVPHISAAEKAKKYLRMRYIGLSFDSISNYEPVDSVSEMDFYRGRHNLASLMSTSGGNSYNNFLHVNRMGLWPSQGRIRGRPSRFVVTPVSEVERSSPLSRPRNLPSNVLDTVTTV